MYSYSCLFFFLFLYINNTFWYSKFDFCKVKLSYINYIDSIKIKNPDDLFIEVSRLDQLFRGQKADNVNDLTNLIKIGVLLKQYGYPSYENSDSRAYKTVEYVCNHNSYVFTHLFFKTMSDNYKTGTINSETYRHYLENLYSSKLGYFYLDTKLKSDEEVINGILKILQPDYNVQYDDLCIRINQYFIRLDSIKNKFINIGTFEDKFLNKISIYHSSNFDEIILFKYIDGFPCSYNLIKDKKVENKFWYDNDYNPISYTLRSNLIVVNDSLNGKRFGRKPLVLNKIKHDININK